MPVALSDSIRDQDILLLQRIAEGSRDAASDLYEVLSSELRRLASIQMERQSPEHTLQITALVNEAWLRIVRRGTCYTS